MRRRASKSLLVTDAFTTLARRLEKLERAIDPGHVPMLAYVRELGVMVRATREEFIDRCMRESGGPDVW